MKKIIILSLSIYIFTTFLTIFPQDVQPNTPSNKKRIVILTTTGGGGNFEASKALQNYLQDSYDIELCYAFEELSEVINPFSFFSTQSKAGEEFYNALIPGKHFTLLSWIYSFGTWYIQLQKEKANTLLHNYFTKTKPNLIISVIPIINNIVLDVAQNLNIPFLLMPTDLDVKPYITHIKEPTYKKFYIGLPFDNKEIKAPINDALIPSDHVITVGAPVKKDFLAAKDKNNLKQEFAIDQNKSVIMVLMGSHGSDEMKEYVSELSKIIMTPIHIIACIGKNEKIRQNLTQIILPKNVSLSIVGFTNRIADYMTVSDILVSKSGTLSVCEALYMNLPLLLDATSTLLPWEEFNHHFINKHGYGESIKEFDTIAPLVTNIIKYRDLLQKYKSNIQQLQKKDCSYEIPVLVEKILNE